MLLKDIKDCDRKCTIQKRIKYFGIDVYIPDDDISHLWKFIATDKDGTVCLYTHEPESHNSVRYGDQWVLTDNEYSDYTKIMEIDVGDEGIEDWKDSLLKITLSMYYGED